jgi:predicted Rossmann fold nucleotide-binding protein DprA/Smf involved in DNA uptake
VSRRSDAEIVALLLVQRLVDSGTSPLKTSEFASIQEAVGDLGQLLGADAECISALAGVGLDMGERIAALLEVATSFAFALEDAEHGGLRVLTRVGDDYPSILLDRLGRMAPPILYLLGDLDLTNTPGFGVVGSRDVGEEGATVARRAAAMAAEHDLGVVSGGAKGVDRLAMGAALEAGGKAVGVLADSLLRAARDADVRRAINDGSLCLLTPYKPTVGFTVANAMGRNKLIYALAGATLVVACDREKGGSWSGAVEALRQDISPVLVWTGLGAGDGNRPLVERGAQPIDDIECLFPLPQRAAGPRPVSAANQLALGL